MITCCRPGETAAFDLIASFVIGLVGSVHCLGMCGPIVLAYSLQLQTPATASRFRTGFFKKGFIHHLAFHSGRLIIYALLGGSAAALFHVAGMTRFLSDFRGWIVLLGGVLMVYFGLVFLKILHLPEFLSNPPAKKSRLGHWVSFGLHSPRPVSKLLLGMAAGFLPCGLSWAMLVRAGATESIAEGLLVMAFFGMGTLPVLLFSGVAASLLSLRIRLLGERLAACSLILLGLILVSRGVRFFA